MRKTSRRTWLMLVAALALIGAGFVYSCGGSKSTNPGYGGGGGGGGGPEINSPTLGSGAEYSHTFNTAGTFPYHCAIHPSTMTGNQVVVDPLSVVASDSIAVIGQSGGPAHTGYSKASTTIKVGGTVKWHNTDGMGHTVTSGS
jgi:plastocyanin